MAQQKNTRVPKQKNTGVPQQILYDFLKRVEDENFGQQGQATANALKIVKYRGVLNWLAVYFRYGCYPIAIIRGLGATYNQVPAHLIQDYQKFFNTHSYV